MNVITPGIREEIANDPEMYVAYLTDMMMSASGAFAGLLAGPGLALVGYPGLSVAAMFFVGGAFILVQLVRHRQHAVVGS
jgi:hypothetical protein